MKIRSGPANSQGGYKRVHVQNHDVGTLSHTRSRKPRANNLSARSSTVGIVGSATSSTCFIQVKGPFPPRRYLGLPSVLTIGNRTYHPRASTPLALMSDRSGLACLDASCHVVMLVLCRWCTCQDLNGRAIVGGSAVRHTKSQP